MRRDDAAFPNPPSNDRPSDRYRCGASCSGNGSSPTCPLGPSVRGRCQNEKEPCVPQPTASLVAKRRKRVMFAVGVLALVMATSVWGYAFYKPGELSTPHAQILAGQMSTASCAACHPQAEISPLSWFLSGHRESEIVQTDRCMDCHHTTLPRDFARSAHNLSPDALSQLTIKQLTNHSTRAMPVSLNRWLPDPAVSMTDIACAACHREHAGPHADITALTNSQCQTCHATRFESFAVDHPPFGDWPYHAASAETIAFDHSSHAKRHFPSHRNEDGTIERFDCLRCHPKNDAGEFVRTADYATTCGECHDQSLQQQSGQRLDLFVLPSLDESNSKSLGGWPEKATGFYDGSVGPLAKIILGPSETTQSALQNIPGNGNFSRINPNNQGQVNAAQTVAAAIRDSLHEMALKGPIPASSHLQEDHPELHQLLQGLPPQLVADATARWFSLAPRGKQVSGSPQVNTLFKTTAARRGNNDDPLLADDPLADEPLVDDPLAEQDPLTAQDESNETGPPAVKFDPVTMQPRGGWYADDSRLAISYRGFAHADPVLKAAIELAAGLPRDSSLRNDLLASGPAVGCIQCHPARGDAGDFRWTPDQTFYSNKSQFTKFSHGPHMTLPVLADCKACHTVAPGDGLKGSMGTAPPDITSASLNGTSQIAINPHAGHDFLPVSRQLCASCHTAAAAGDSCIKCHRYHSATEVAAGPTP